MMSSWCHQMYINRKVIPSPLYDFNVLFNRPSTKEKKVRPNKKQVCFPLHARIAFWLPNLRVAFLFFFFFFFNDVYSQIITVQKKYATKWFLTWTCLDICVYLLTGGNWQKWKRVFLTCLCHEIYKDEAVGLKSCKNTWKITIFVKMWNLGQYRENLIFCQ